jgi:hypothetical protein
MKRVISTLVVVLLLASWPSFCLATEQLLELSYDGLATVSISLDVYYPVAWAYVRHTGPAQLHFESMIDYAQYSTHRYYFPEYRFGIATLDTVITCQSATCPTGPLVIYSCPLGCGCALTGVWTDAYDGDYSRTYNYKLSVAAGDSYGAAGSLCRNAVMRVSRFEEVDGRVSLAFSFYDSESIRGTVSVSWDMPVPVDRTTWGSIKNLYR